VWNAGYEAFLEPQIAISAMRGLGQIDPRIKMVFLPPQPGRVSEQAVFASLQESARDQGLLGANVIALSEPPSRVRYRAILREASAVIACASNSADNRLWHGAPAVEAIGAQTPVLCTRGSFMATLTEDLRLGYTMTPGDPVDVAEKIARVCDPANSNQMRAHLHEVASHFSWEQAARGLLDFLKDVPDASGGAAQGGWRDSLLRAKERLLG
jgi:glycosyltransferase involved in cell wall biosynthesis